jgi:hypothetical protein
MLIFKEAANGWRRPYARRVVSQVCLVIVLFELIVLYPLVDDETYVGRTRVFGGNMATTQAFSIVHPAETEGIRSVRSGNHLMFFLTDASGAYYLRTRTIVISDDPDDSFGFSSDLFVNFHEIGHHVWHNLLTDEERKNYTQHYNDTQWRPSSYARTSVFEDFADSYAIFTAKAPYLDDFRTEILNESLSRIRAEYEMEMKVVVLS